MPTVFIQAPPSLVFRAMCDLTRHAKWAAHEITIKAGHRGRPSVGKKYTSAHDRNEEPDRLTVTELTRGERFGFHVVMPNGWELDFSMTVEAREDGTLVTRKAKMGKMPGASFLTRLIVPLVGNVHEKKFLDNMKAELEGTASS
jgi:uncharacterized protein YndB with AHSA1/START domain